MIKIILYISLLHNLRKFKTLITFTIDKLLTQKQIQSYGDKRSIFQEKSDCAWYRIRS